MTNWIKGLLIQGTYAGLVVAGWLYGIDGARNLAQFATWAILLPVGIMAAGSDALHASMAKHPPSPAAIRALARALNWALLSVLLWHGAWMTGTAFGLFMLGGAVGTEAAKKLRASAAGVAA
jgi:hypothetical protein